MSRLVLDWVKQNNVMNTLSDNTYPTAASDASGNIYVTYYTNGTASGGQNTGNFDIVVFKMNVTGTVQWVRQNAIMNTTAAEYYPSIVCDTVGNIYVSYYTYGTTSGNQASAVSSSDIVVFKMDSSGTVQWVRQNAIMNTSNLDYSPKIVCDASGNLYVTYYTIGTTSGGQNMGPYDIVVFKMDSSGTVQWVRQNAMMNTSVMDYYPTIVCDASGNIYVSYYTYGTTSGNQASALSSSDIVVFKMDSSGTVQWVRQNAMMNTSAPDNYPTIACDTSGNLYVAYYTNGTVSGGQNTGASQDIVVFKMDSSGTVQWVRQNAMMNTSAIDSLPTIACDASGNLYIAYYTVGGTMSGGQNIGGNDIIIFKMDTTGSVLWVRQDPILNTYRDEANPFIVFNNNNIYVVYQTKGMVNGQLHTTPTTDIVVTKMTQSGVFTQAIQELVMNTDASDNNPSIVYDASGNLYVTYYTLGTASGGRNSGGFDIVVFKMDSSGTVKWVRQNAIMNTSMADNYPTVACDASGNLYVAYYTNGTASGQQNTGSNDIVVFKMDSSGTVQWVRQNSMMNTSVSDYNPTIACDPSGNLYVTYYTYGGTASGGQNAGTTYDIVIFKMDSSGTVQWVRQNAMMNTSAAETVPTITTDVLGNLYVAYNTNGVTTSGGQNTGSYDIVVFKMDSSGTVQWVRQNSTMNTSTSDSNPTITNDLSGNLYVAYYTSGTTSGGQNTGSYDIVVFKMDSAGTVQWVRQNSNMNTIVPDYNPKIACDTSGNLYVAYYTVGGTALDGQNTGSSTDIVVFKMDSTGTVQWVRQNSNMNTGGTENYPVIKVGPSGDLIITYTTDRTVGNVNYGGLSNDIVVAKLRELPLYPPIADSTFQAYLTTALAQSPPVNIDGLKTYIRANAPSLSDYPVCNVPGSLLSHLVSPSSAVSSSANVKVIFPTEGSVSVTDRNICLFGISGDVFDLQVGENNYTLTLTNNGVQYGTSNYIVGEKIHLGNHRFRLNYTGSGGGELYEVINHTSRHIHFPIRR